MANEIQTLSFNPAPTSGTYTLTFTTDTTTALNFNDSAGTIQAALEALPSIGAGNINVSGTADAGLITLQFIGALANTNVAQTTADASGLGAPGSVGSVTETQAGALEQATLNFTPGGGTNSFVVNVDGSDSGTIFDTATANLVQSAISGTTVVDSTGNPNGGSLPYTITFNDGLSHALSIDNDTGTGASITPSTTTAASAEVQSLPYPNATGGTFTLAGQTVVYNPATADIQTALDTALGAGVVTVTQPLGAGTAFTITWTATGPQSLLTDDSSGLTTSVTADGQTTQQGGAAGAADDSTFNRCIMLIG